MKRRHRQRMVLLLGVTVLVGWALWQRAQDLHHAAGTLLPMEPSSITRVDLRLRAGATEHYRKRDGHWWRVDGTPTRADDGRLDELTEIARAPVVAWRPGSDFDPARIGLDPPRAVLSLDGHSLAFGETLVTAPLRYVRVGQRIAQVSIRYAPRPALSETTPAR